VAARIHDPDAKRVAQAITGTPVRQAPGAVIDIPVPLRH
jgi:hypothetical protein